MIRAQSRFASAVIFCATLLLALGLGAQTKAHADDFAAGNAALLDPFDPVPQIRFSDCYDRCGGDCYDNCGYHRHCRHGCGDYGRWRDGWRCDHDCRDWDRGDWHCERDCGPRPIDFGKIWLDRMHDYDQEMDKWHGDMHEWHDAMGEWREENGHWFFRHHEYADHEWRQDGGHWRYWHDNDWHDDGYDDYWHDGHHDGGHHDDHH